MKDSGDGAAVAVLLTVSHVWYRWQHHLLRPHGLTGVQLQVLKAVREGRVSSLGDLAEHLNTTAGNVTAIVDALERNGWLVRERIQEDRRVVRLRLTKKASTLEGIDQAHRAALVGPLKALTSEDQEVVWKALHSLFDALQDLG